jgi:hypothetical protein
MLFFFLGLCQPVIYFCVSPLHPTCAQDSRYHFLISAIMSARKKRGAANDGDNESTLKTIKLKRDNVSNTYEYLDGFIGG